MFQAHVYRITFLFLLIFAGEANANPFFVAKTGSDQNSCAQARNVTTPKLTISGGISCLSSGETLIVFSGTYFETNLGNAIPNGTSWDNVTTIRVNTGDTVTIIPSGDLNRAWFFGGGNSKSYIEIDGLGCDGQNLVAHCAKIEGTSHHLRFRNVHFRNTRGSLMLFAEVAGDNSPGSHEILDSHLHHAGQDPTFGTHAFDHGIYLEQDNTKIWGNKIHDIPGWGLHIYNGHTNVTPENNNIQYNVLWNCGDTQFGTNRGQAITNHGNDTLIANNLMYNNLEGGIGVWGSRSKIYNNTITGSIGGINNGGLYIGNSNNHLIKNNIIWESNIPAITYNNFTVTESNNLVSNPLFIDESAHNYYLSANSNAINNGVPLSEVVDDLNRNVRPQGGATDIGAYEYVGPLSSIPMPPMLIGAN